MIFEINKGSFIQYARKIFWKANISYPVIRVCAYQGVKNVSFPEKFVYILHESSMFDNNLTLVEKTLD